MLTSVPCFSTEYWVTSLFNANESIKQIKDIRGKIIDVKILQEGDSAFSGYVVITYEF